MATGLVFGWFWVGVWVGGCFGGGGIFYFWGNFGGVGLLERERERERKREREIFLNIIWCVVYIIFELYVKIRIEMLGISLNGLVK